MTDEHAQVLDRLEDAIGALVAQRHGPGRLIGAWEIMIETIDPSRPDLTAWMQTAEGRCWLGVALSRCAVTSTGATSRTWTDDE